ncbi:mechanosensitive ion channel protein MscS [Burkholderia ubonensis]|uniref:mechanosensitive ion channel family protein n=1 Tax=Burkholderia ubonensis TaxID=101571 RepID=UPI000757B5C5|nr:mechanosensitive ion channel family protein [Burkholderia ubonensis]KVP63297.1 mechanosensitive ion channel protein MscS [Burkholderia ubonensis]KWB65041.1 mechanosensitive ion channel protein MscS [Burkholderia ubonensis]
MTALRSTSYGEPTLTLDLATAQQFLMTRGLDFGLNLVAAIALWFVGRWAIRVGTRLLGKIVQRSGKVDPTLSDYLTSVVGVLLTILLILAILQIFGVQTTSFAALLAGLGLAIGTAWGGLLAHFAAGVFMQVLRPFKIGDVINAGGVTGTVKEMGLFGTTIVTADNIVTIVGNNKIFSDNIANYSATPYRRVDLSAKIANGVDAVDAINRLKESVQKIPNVLTTPAPDVGVLQFTPEGPLLFVRPFTQPANYWQVYCDTNRAILDTFRDAQYPTPETPISHRTA